MSVERNYDLWNDALDGKTVDWPRNVAMPGFYRKQERNGGRTGIAIWVGSDGRPVVKVGKAPPQALRTAEQEADWCEYVFAWCSKHPVEQAQYDAWIETGRWHDEVPEARVDTNGEPHVVVDETIADLKRQAEAWLKDVGGKVETQAHADLAANYANRFAELANEAEAKRVAAKEPHLKAGREVDALWNPIRDAGNEAKTWAKRLTDEFLKAETARKLKEAADAAASGQVVRAADTKVKAGTRGRATSLRASTEPHVTDMAALIEHYRSDARFWKRPAVCAELGAQAAADIRAGLTVPGFELRTVQSAT